MKNGIKCGSVIGAIVMLLGVMNSSNAANPAPTYMIPANSAVKLKVLATSGDLITGSVIKGIPDGMGAMKGNKGMISLLANFEHSITSPFVKSQEKTDAVWGASITKFNYSPRLGAITSADNNFIQSVNFWHYSGAKWVSSPSGAAPVGAPTGSFGWGLQRFCSANLAPASALSFNDGGKVLGYENQMYLVGEEVGDASRAFAFDMDGVGYQFPRIGTASWENLVAGTKPGKNTVVLGLEDGSATNSHVHLYIGEKQATGNNFERAGLNNGKLYVLNIPTAASDNVFRTAIGKNKPTAVEFKAVNWNQSITDFDQSVTAAGSEFARVEDGEWDPNNPNVFYFVTTESNKDPIATAPNPATPAVTRDGGALWRLTFKDSQNPLQGASLEMLLNGGESIYMSKPDNIAVTKSGIVMIQEDPGNNDHVARVVAYRIKDQKVATVAKFDDRYFAKGGSDFLTLDEESSGIIEVTDMLAKKGDKNSYFFLNAQVHTPNLLAARPDLKGRRTVTTRNTLNNLAVEGGQFYLMSISDWDSIFKS
jgi:hypothetical protein